jgi:hypothetical protein
MLQTHLRLQHKRVWVASLVKSTALVTQGQTVIYPLDDTEFKMKGPQHEDPSAKCVKELQVKGLIHLFLCVKWHAQYRDGLSLVCEPRWGVLALSELSQA